MSDGVPVAFPITAPPETRAEAETVVVPTVPDEVDLSDAEIEAELAAPEEPTPKPAKPRKIVKNDLARVEDRMAAIEALIGPNGTLEQRIIAAMGRASATFEEHMARERTELKALVDQAQTQFANSLRDLRVAFNPARFAEEAQAHLAQYAPKFTAGQVVGEVQNAEHALAGLRDQVAQGIQRTEQETQVQAVDLGAAVLGRHLAARLGIGPDLSPALSGMISTMIQQNADKYPAINMFRQAMMAQGVNAYAQHLNGGAPQNSPGSKSSLSNSNGWTYHG